MAEEIVQNMFKSVDLAGQSKILNIKVLRNYFSPLGVTTHVIFKWVCTYPGFSATFSVQFKMATVHLRIGDLVW